MPVRVNVGDSALFIVIRYIGRGLQVSFTRDCWMVVCWQTAVLVFRLASVLFGSPLAGGLSVCFVAGQWLASGLSVCFMAGQWPKSFCFVAGHWPKADCFVAGQWLISLFCGWPVAKKFVLWLASGQKVCFVAGQCPISLFCGWPVASQFVLWLASGQNQFVLWLASGQNQFVLWLTSGWSVCFVADQWPISLLYYSFVRMTAYVL